MLLLAGCSDSDSAPGSSSEGQALRIGISEPVGVLDPHAFTGNFLVLDMVYEPLVRYGGTGEIEPGLAESWEVSDDGRTVTFELRDGMLFQDGTDVDAEAVKWNLDRWVGGEDYSFFRTAEVIEEVNVVDEATVELGLSEPFEPLLQELSTNRPVRFLSPASVAEDGSFADPVGTGPWMLQSNSETDASLVRFDDYWGETSSIDRIDISVIPDSQTRASALQADEVDLIGGAYLSPITPVEATSLQAVDGVELLEGEPDTTSLLAFNSDGPLGEQEVREAVSRVIDLDALHEALYGDFGAPASALFPPSIPDSGGSNEYTFDPDEARDLLDRAGWIESGGGRARDGQALEMDLLVSSESTDGQIDSRVEAEAVTAALDDVGIDVTINAVGKDSLFDELSAGNYDLAFYRTLGAPYDPSSSVVSYFTSGADAEIATSPELDGLVDDALSALTEEERVAAYQAINEELTETAAFLPITFLPRFWAVRDNVEGFEVPHTEYVLDLSDVSVAR